MPHGMLSIDVPIIVFHMAKLGGKLKQHLNRNYDQSYA